jgi:hypothetical protein
MGNFSRLLSGKSPFVIEGPIIYDSLFEALLCCVQGTPFRRRDLGDLTDFFFQCRRQGLLGELCLNIQNFGHPDQRVREYASEAYKLEFFHAARYQVFLDSIHKCLLDSGQQVLLLKGAALCLQGHYKLGCRHVSDIDAYVSPESLGTVAKALAGLGLNVDLAGTYSDPSGCHLDLHSGSLGLVEDMCGLSPSACWANSQPIDGYPAFRALTAEFHLSYLSLHALKHCYSRLIWLCDIQRVSSSLSTPAWNHPAQAKAYQCANYLLKKLTACSLKDELKDPNILERWLLNSTLMRSDSPAGQVLIALNQSSLFDTARLLSTKVATPGWKGQQISIPVRIAQKLSSFISGLSGRSDQPIWHPFTQAEKEEALNWKASSREQPEDPIRR